MTKKKAVFLDIDNTIIDGSTIRILGLYVYRKKMIGLKFLIKIIYYYMLYKLNFLKDTSKLLQSAFENTQNRDVTTTNQLVEECFNTEISKRFFPEMEKLINDFHQKGFEIFFVSSSLDIFGRLIVNKFGFGKAITTVAEIKENVYTGKIVGKVCFGEEKINFIKQSIDIKEYDLAASYAYSDHISDLPLLNLVGHPCVINPKWGFKKIALEKHWEIKELSL